MKWFLDLSTRAKLFLGFGLMILFLVVVIATSYKGITAIRDSERKLFEEEFENALDLKDVRSNQNAVRADVLAMMLATNRSDQDKLNQEIKERSKETTERIQRLLKRNEGNPNLFSRLQEFNAARIAYRDTRETQIIPLIYEGKIEEAKELALSIQAERNEKMREITNGLIDEAEKEARASVAQAEQTAHESVRLFLIIGLLALAIGGALALSLNRIIASPLKRVSDMAVQIAAGDLTIKPTTTERKDEVGVLTRSFGTMVEGLRNIVSQVLITSEGVSSASQQLSSSAQEMNATTQEVSSTVQQIAKGSETTAQRVQETSRVMEQMNASVTQIATSAQQAAAASVQANDAARKGGGSVQDAVGKMKRIFETVTASAEVVKKLGNRSEQITEIVKVITDIADQTNLLALNAAIEAARAGEAGRGFAVVADEVRKLAEGSARAADQISALIREVQKETTQAVTAMAQGSQEVSEGREVANRAGESLGEIVKLAENVASMVEQISAASEQMSAGTKQVVKSVDDIASTAEEAASATEEASASTEEMTASMEEMTASAQELADMSVGLRQLVGKFRLDGAAPGIGAETKGSPEPHIIKVTRPITERLKADREKLRAVREQGTKGLRITGSEEKHAS